MNWDGLGNSSVLTPCCSSGLCKYLIHSADSAELIGDGESSSIVAMVRVVWALPRKSEGRLLYLYGGLHLAVLVCEPRMFHQVGAEAHGLTTRCFRS